MKSLHNIEKSSFRRGEYVGYAHGPWRIYQPPGRKPKWIALHVAPGCTRPALRADTLVELSALLEQESRRA